MRFSNTKDLILELKNICKTYDNKKYVLDGLNFALSKGELVIIEGKSGVGKSTLMNVIGLLDDFSEGEYYLYGKPLRKSESDKVRANMIGFVFQAYHLVESLTVKENILLPFLYNDKEFGNKELLYYNQLIEKLGIKELEMKKAGLLSGGEKQRTAIARALIKNPEIIIADEPTGNLDFENTELVISILRSLCKEEKSVIIVTHDVTIAKADDRVLHLKDGKLIG